MKTLVRSQAHPTIAISAGRLMRKEKERNCLIKLRDAKQKISYLTLFCSLSIFLLLPESPKLTESVCTRHNSALACNVW